LYQILELAKERPEESPIKFVIFLGDVFELKDRVPNHMLSELAAWIADLEDLDIVVVFLLGNHDRNLLNWSTVEMFNLNFDIIDRPGIYRIGLDRETRIYFIPFQRDWEDFESAWKKAHETKEVNVIAFHQAVPGGMADNGWIKPGSFDPEYRDDILYLSGDLHVPQKVGKIQYLGSPYSTEFGVNNENYFIWLWDRNKNEIQSLRLNYPQFRDFPAWRVREKDYGNCKSFVKGNYIRIVGEERAESWAAVDTSEARETLENMGAKFVVFNVTKERPRQVKIPAGLDEKEILEKFVSEELPESLQGEGENIREIGTEILEEADDNGGNY
jgi:DNA repair exonuclease SbcCD nuclease subunit